jgi:NAD(P)-dependent dehydrogenase (short-subunit alcohol dehydrogenase family)
MSYEQEGLGKCAIVTGGNRNIGQGIAITLAKRGYDLAICYATDLQGANKTKEVIEKMGRRCFVYQAQLDEPDAPEQFVTKAYRDLGRIDVMVCNAGRDMRCSVLTTTASDLDWLYQNNIRNYFLCTGAAARYMVRDGIAGSIILITSVRAQLPHPDDYYYGAVKAAMERAAKSMALDLSEFKIRVNCLAPGAIWVPDEKGEYMNTPFVSKSIPLQRTGTAWDCGEAAAFLAGEQSSYVTGTTLLVDGGLSLPGLLEGYDEIPWKTERFTKKRYEEAMKWLDGKE